MHRAGIKVRTFCSNQGDFDLSRTDIAICTIEKAIDEEIMREVGLIVVDELYIFNDNAGVNNNQHCVFAQSEGNGYECYSAQYPGNCHLDAD